jgi:hypothetical protein
MRHSVKKLLQSARVFDRSARKIARQYLSPASRIAGQVRRTRLANVPSTRPGLAAILNGRGRPFYIARRVPSGKPQTSMSKTMMTPRTPSIHRAAERESLRPYLRRAVLAGGLQPAAQCCAIPNTTLTGRCLANEPMLRHCSRAPLPVETQG